MDLTFLFLVLGILAAAATLVAYACIVVGARSEQPPDSSFFAKDNRHKQEKNAYTRVRLSTGVERMIWLLVCPSF